MPADAVTSLAGNDDTGASPPVNDAVASLAGNDAVASLAGNNDIGASVPGNDAVASLARNDAGASLPGSDDTGASPPGNDCHTSSFSGAADLVASLSRFDDVSPHSGTQDSNQTISQINLYSPLLCI